MSFREQANLGLLNLTSCMCRYGSTLDTTESQSVSSQELQLEFQPYLAYSKPLEKVFMRYGEDNINESMMDMMRSFTLLWQGQDELVGRHSCDCVAVITFIILSSVAEKHSGIPLWNQITKR